MKTYTTFVIGCCHMPYHDRIFWNQFVQAATDIQPDQIILNGDLLDLASLSPHKKEEDPIITLEEEFEEANRELDKIQGLASQMVYIYGNHEQRHERHAQPDMPSIIDGLRLLDRGYTVIPYREGYQVGDCFVTHGYHTGTTAAKRTLETHPDGRYVLFSHTHKIGTFHYQNRTGLNIGWAGSATASTFAYASDTARSSWQHAFAVIRVAEDGSTKVKGIKRTDGHFTLKGKTY